VSGLVLRKEPTFGCCRSNPLLSESEEATSQRTTDPLRDPRHRRQDSASCLDELGEEKPDATEVPHLKRAVAATSQTLSGSCLAVAVRSMRPTGPSEEPPNRWHRMKTGRQAWITGLPPHTPRRSRNSQSRGA